MSIVSKIKVGVVGASGYTGSELLRLLVNHHNVEIVFAYSKTTVSYTHLRAHET